MNGTHDIRPEGLRISEVVERTGLSKELVHHYLRQGVLPPCETRARYGPRQVRLLHLVRKLREELHLPLETIRSFFELFAFDPEWLEPVFHLESLSLRLERFAETTDLGLGHSLSADELADEAGITQAALDRLVAARVVEPIAGSEPPRFTAYDVNVAALCHRGERLGIPFAAFRTVAAYVRVGFELQHRQFIQVDLESAESAEHMLVQVFVRRELTSAFVNNVLHSLMQRFVHSVIGRRAGAGTSLDDIVYRPSDAFVARHGLGPWTDRVRQRTCETPDSVDVWRRAAELHLHTGAYQEAAFALEQAVDQWPGDDTCQSLYGAALAVAGERDRAAAHLTRLHGRGAGGTEAAVYLGLVRFQCWSADDGADVDATRTLAGIRELADGALAAPQDETPLHARYLAAWLLTALPPAFRRLAAGREALAEILDDLEAPGPGHGFPGVRQRHRINAAWLLLESLGREGEPPPEGLPPRQALADLICRLDPASRLAERAFLIES